MLLQQIITDVPYDQLFKTETDQLIHKSSINTKTYFGLFPSMQNIASNTIDFQFNCLNSKKKHNYSIKK
jgi:hypothetical protein